MPAGRVQTGPDALRDELRSAELMLVALRPGAGRREAVALLHCLDRIDEAAEHLGQRGVDLRAEQARIETIHNMALQESRIVVRALAGEWDAVRAEVEATSPRWWWYLDQREGTARARRRRQTAWITGGAVLVLGLVAVAYLLLLRPDEAVRRRVALVAQAEGLVETGSYAEALELYRQAAEAAPNEPEFHVAMGALHEAMGEAQAADEAYDRAEALYGNPARCWADRSGRYLLLAWWPEAEGAAQAAIELDPDLAVSYCHLGSAYEAQGRIQAAIEALRACGERAREQGQDELYVLSASRLALLLQAPRTGGG